MKASMAKAGAIAGWLSLITIFGYHIGLTILAGNRVSGTSDVAAIQAYYQHGVIAPASLLGPISLVAILVFVYALRETLAAASPRARALATLGLLFVVIELPILLVQLALEAALVSVAASGGDVLGLFRFWDVLYNSGAYALEASYLVCFGLAMRDAAAFPRWLPNFSLVVGAAQVVNMFAIWVGIPDTATLPANMLFGVWFAATSVGLGRVAARTASRPVTAPTLA
jgi:hypothetical protein